jgi:tetratricopeptide (TPR) repeat protein
MAEENISVGLSNKIKIPIIILTFVTICAMGGMFIKVAYSISKSEKSTDSLQYLRTIGDKLQDKGLYEQSIEQYIKYLKNTNRDEPSYSEVAHNIGELYMKLSNCQEALVWLFHAETTETKYSRAEELKIHIDTCLVNINSQKPTNLNTK